MPHLKMRGDAAPPARRQLMGALPSGGRYVIDVPAAWNGVLLIYSVGYIIGPPGQPPRNAPDEEIREWLLVQGYALAGSQPVGVGWAVEEIMPDQMATLEHFRALVGVPRYVIAWGTSMGGLITAGLIEHYPGQFDGAIPLCGSVAGGLGMLNQALDAAFALRTLLAPEGQLVRFASYEHEQANVAYMRATLAAAQQTAQGRARIALAAAFAQLSTWSVVDAAEPEMTDWPAQQQQQYEAVLFAVFSPRQPLEARAGGNFSWNTGVDYRRQLARSGRARLVAALYRAAGLDLQADLDALEQALRIAADPPAVDYMVRNVTPSGDIGVPVLTLHEIGDNAPTVTQARAYRDAVRAAGKTRLLRQAYVRRPGHCRYTPAELAAVVLTLEQRLEDGSWGGSATAGALNALATRLAATARQTLGTSGFVDYRPDPFLRPFFPALQRI
jgi:hypothetical protein